MGKSENFKNRAIKSEVKRLVGMEERATLMFLRIHLIWFSCFENQIWRFSFSPKSIPNFFLSVHILPAPPPIPHLNHHQHTHFSFSLCLFQPPFSDPRSTLTMADKENIFRLTRGSKKRSAEAATPHDRSANKRRVVLGELPILQNATSSSVDRTSRSRPSRHRRRLKSRDTAETSAAAQINTLPDADVKLSDEGNSEDPQMCTVFASDIYEYLRAMETDPRRRPLPDYIGRVQKDISANMRGILVDWLVEVAKEYKLVSDTLYLSISYVDRYLSLNAISRQKLQLLGVSAMLIASKYEEISPPHVEEFVYITDNTYNREEVVEMEADILKSLEFELGSPTIKTFLRRFTMIAQETYEFNTLQFEFLGYYLAELSLLDYNCVKFLPSLIAASVIFLARFMIQPKKHPWTSRLEHFTGYKPADMKDCVLLVHDLYLSRRGGALAAIREKYKQHKYKFVSIMPSPPEIPIPYFEDVRI
ncbi:putative cyclin-A3-1 isoform X1 [Cucurbita maxima]|uniref:B-like cyclin n=2 Tax=Cucurbita maxima TaxID=3661 RepID=A0A6J1J4B8_CUCMA|nr:putative cyclin-A3-1 isoform X1 [Cucurbita maxima]XP_022982233.1 putative cyclin-A3-1 isoform X1 [Cucurbita maxima]XP_022982234.1 putative cyclin-A3-1 isoform X1 [Cucurbita maxima]